MSKKILVLVRNKNVLRIYDEDDDLRGTAYTAIYDITHLKQARGFSGWYDMYYKEKAMGFVSNVKEVKEKW